MENKNFFKQSVASVLLVSLLVQSCYNPNSSSTPSNNPSNAVVQLQLSDDYNGNHVLRDSERIDTEERFANEEELRDLIQSQLPVPSNDGPNRNAAPTTPQNTTPNTNPRNPLAQLTRPFEITSQQGAYTVFPRINIQLRDEVFKQTGLWLRFPEGQTEIAFVVGQGYSGGMYLAQSKDMKRFLGVKIISGERHIQESAEEGRQQMQLNGLKHLMPLVDSFTTELQGEKVLLHVMPLAGLGNVKSISKALQQKELPVRIALTYHIARGMMTGLQQMHAHNLYHLDLKAANVVVDKDGKVWVIDFGCMQKSDTGSFDRDCNGDVNCLSPERLKIRNGNYGYFSGAAADSWSVGIVLLQLLAGELEDRYLEDPTPLLNRWQRDHSLPEAWIQLLKGLLNPVETRRLTVTQALDQLDDLEPENLNDAIQQLPTLVHNLQTGEGEQAPPLIIKPKRRFVVDKRPIPILPADKLQELQAHYKTALKKQYLQHSTLTPLFGKPLALENSYINVAIIQTEERKEKKRPEQESQENKERGKENKEEGQEKDKLKPFHDERLSSFEDLFGEKRQIAIEQLFDSRVSGVTPDTTTQERQGRHCEPPQGAWQTLTPPTAKHRFALVQGRAGIGKTTLSRYISYQWAKDQLWKEDYDWVFRITLRELTQNPAFQQKDKQNYTLEELIYHTCFPEEEWPTFAAFWYQHLSLQAPEKLLFILDGYDEIATITSNPKHPLYNPLQELLNKGRFTVLLTTRPYGLSDLPHQRQNLEIMGFSHDNMEAYVKQYFTQLHERPEEANTNSQNLLSFLQQHPSVWSNAHIPINLNLLCGIHEKLKEDKTSFGMSELYLQLEETLLERAWEIENNGKLKRRAKVKRELLYQEYVQERNFLQRLAFQAMQQESIIIHEDLLEAVLKQVVPQQPSVKSTEEAKDAFIRRIHQIGLLKPTTAASAYAEESERDKPHEFMHLTFQEYFAAHYVAEGLLSTDPAYRSEVIQFIRTEKFNPQYQIIFWFVAGILQAHGQKLGDYLNLLQERATRDLLEDYQMGLLVRCYEEGCAADQAVLQTTFIALQAYLKKQLKWVEHRVDHISINLGTSHFFTMLSMSQRLQQQLGDWVAMNLHNYLQSEDVGQKVFQFIVLTQFAHPKLLKILVGALKDQNSWVRSSVAEALGKIGEKVSSDEAINALVGTLKDPDSRVRSSAAEALGKMGGKVSSDEAINALVGALKDQDTLVRSYAAYALGNMGEKAAIPAIPALVGALKDQVSYVRSSAAKALGKMGEKISSDEAINALVGALKDEDNDVRWSAAEALGKMGEKVSSGEAINALVGALKDQVSYVRSSAAKALGKMGEKISSDEAINALVGALKDQDYNVRRSAAEMLGNMGEKVATPTVIQGLVGALKDQEYNVRSSAAKALGNIGEKAATSEVIQALIGALKDEADDVRWSAAEALGKMGEKAATSEVIPALVGALKDQHLLVRISAAGALGNMGEKATTSAVIQALVGALKEPYVRGYAAEALGNLGKKVIENIIAVVLSQPGGSMNANLVIALAYCCMQGKASMQIQAKQQNYNLVTFINKNRYVHPINKQQAQVLLHVLPVAVSMLMGLEPFSISHCKNTCRKLVILTISMDPLLQELSTTTEISEVKPMQITNSNASSGGIFSKLTSWFSKTEVALPQSEPSSPVSNVSASPAKTLQEALQAIVALGNLSIMQEGKVVQLKLSVNNNSADVGLLLMDLQPSLEALPEWKYMDNCDIEEGVLVITMKTNLNAKQLQKKVEEAWREVKGT